MKPKLFFHTIFLIVTTASLCAQDKANVRFGNVSDKDLSTKFYAVDSAADAVIIADIGSRSIEGNTKGWFSVQSKHYKRVHILKKNGFDAAKVDIALYSDIDAGMEVRLEKLKAVTYNLVNGKVVETKLDTRSGVFEERLDKHNKIKKFTFPNVKEGSIIEYEYSTTSDFIRFLDPWEFQDNHPVLWSELNFTVPSFFYYVFLRQGYLKYDIESNKEGRTSYNITVPNGTGASDFLRVPAITLDYRWVVKNAPALKEESYTSTINNHIQKIQFQLVEQKDPLSNHKYIESWPQVASDLLKAEWFGESLQKDNSWLNDITAPLIAGSADQLSKAKKIFSWVRDQFTCNDWSSRGMNQTLRNTVKNRTGNVADINILLTALMKNAGIQADPVILSTRSHGKIFPAYPLMEQYNYVVTRIKLNGKSVYLDATVPQLGFGRLPYYCYNGPARIINEEAEEVEFYSDDLVETKITSIFLVNDEKGNLIGSLQQTPGYYESLSLRERLKGKDLKDMQEGLGKGFGMDVAISNFGIDSLHNYDSEVALHFDFDIKEEKADIIYLDPLFGEGYKENPFKSAERLYPVEMLYATDETINLQLEVPHGYRVDELPKSLIVKMNEQEDGIFEYRVSQSGENISLRSRIRFKRAFFLPEEYETLREFFNLIVKKQAEQIVFKKK